MRVSLSKTTKRIATGAASTRFRARAATKTNKRKKTDVAEHPEVFHHVGLLFNETPSRSRASLYLVIRRAIRPSGRARKFQVIATRRTFSIIRLNQFNAMTEVVNRRHLVSNRPKSSIINAIFPP